MKNVLLLAGLLIVSARNSTYGAGQSQKVFRSNDVICLIGGANVVSAQECGYLETFLRVGFSDLNLRLRSLAHEGDTVFAQPRDYNYPALPQQLNEAGATVGLIYFGQMEALHGLENLPRFVAAYARSLEGFGNRRFVLISPFAFESASPPLPNLAPRNKEAREYAAAIRRLAEKRGAGYVDLFTIGKGNDSLGKFTADGLHLNNVGHRYYDWLVAAQLGVNLRESDFTMDGSTGAFRNPAWERIRQTVIAKNQLWWSYYRPTNWAFLGGDRTDQPSSRDHLNPTIRWFPDEMKRFVPLINQSESEISSLAALGPKGNSK